MRVQADSSVNQVAGERRRRALVFSVLSLLVFVVLVALLERRGVDSPGIAAREITALVRTSNSSLTWGQAAMLAGAGIGIGLLGGSLGMGGGVLKVAGLLLVFRYDIHFARTVSLLTMFIMALSATLPEVRALRRKRLVLPTKMMLCSGAAVIVGVLVGSSVRGTVLTHIFGFFVMFLGLNLLGQMLADPRQIDARHAAPVGGDDGRGRGEGVIGGLHGFVCGLLGISGGVISMPMQQLAMNATVRQAIRNSLLVTVVSAGVGSLLIVPIGLASGRLDAKLLIWVVLSVGGGAALGAQLATRLRDRIYANILRGLAVCLCVATGFTILL